MVEISSAPLIMISLPVFSYFLSSPCNDTESVCFAQRRTSLYQEHRALPILTLDYPKCLLAYGHSCSTVTTGITYSSPLPRLSVTRDNLHSSAMAKLSKLPRVFRTVEASRVGISRELPQRLLTSCEANTYSNNKPISTSSKKIGKGSKETIHQDEEGRSRPRDLEGGS